jgi:hypothetical protein
MSKKDLIFLYEFIIKQTKEKPLVDYKIFYKALLEREINHLLIKYNCQPLF